MYLKAAHVIVVVTLLGGMLLLAFALKMAAGAAGRLSDRELLFITRVRRWDKLVTTPALGLVWVLGISLMSIGEWYSSAWLMIKIVPVLILSALHGMESGALRRLANGAIAEPSPIVRNAIAIIAICFVIIAVLAVVKPI
jgi:protoporphyrinogen IX oxidase